MSVVAFIFCILFIACTAIGLYRRLNPQGVLLCAGMTMMGCAIALNVPSPSAAPTNGTGNVVFDLFRIIEETFTGNFFRAGLMIMSIGGYVAFMNQIKATDALVYLSTKPLRIFRRYPYAAATLAIPIGQLLFITTPSATGLGLLLVASVYPILIGLGVSQFTALSVIAAATLFDQGPGSANTALAAELIGKSNVEYFIVHQLPLVLPTILVVMALFYLSNRYFDRKDKEKVMSQAISSLPPEKGKPDVPMLFALLPVLPLALLIVCSPYVAFFDPPVHLDTTMAMLLSLFVSLLCVLGHTRNLRKTFEAVGGFWKGMGNVFANVVTLIVASEIFSKGLISLGFIDSLVIYSSHVGLSGIAIAAFFSLLTFSAAMLMGSGNAAFFSFGPLLPEVASKLGLPDYTLVLPLQLSASMGRAASPIAGIIVAIAGVAGVSPIELARRNAPPLIGSILFLIVYHFITQTF